MKRFKTYLEEGNKFYNAVAAGGLIGLAAITPAIINTYNANRAAEQSTSEPKPKPKDKDDEPTGPKYHHDVIKKMVIQDEGLKTKPYRDTRGILTVGIGHNLEAPNSKSTFKAAFGDQGDALHTHASAGGSLTNEQAQKLFDADYEHHLERAVKLTSNLHEHPPEVQAMIVSATYRGHWGGSPATRKLFDQGKYKEASVELLDNDEFRRENAKTKNRGVANRMLRDAKILHDYGTSLEKK